MLVRWEAVDEERAIVQLSGGELFQDEFFVRADKADGLPVDNSCDGMGE